MARWNSETNQTLRTAQDEAWRRGHLQVDPEHLLIALLSGGSLDIRRVIRQTGADGEAMLRALRQALPGTSALQIDRPARASNRLRIVLRRAAEMIAEAGTLLGPQAQLLIAIAEEASGTAASVLATYLGTLEQIRHVVTWTAQAPTGRAEQAHGESAASSAGRVTDSLGPIWLDQPAGGSDSPPFATAYVDVTGLAARGALDPVVHREAEIARVQSILLGRRRNCPVLIGPPGSGRTAIVEGLACSMAAIRKSHPLAHTRLLAVSVARLAAAGKDLLSLRTMLAGGPCFPGLIFFLDDLSAFAAPTGAAALLELESVLAGSGIRMILRAESNDPVAGRLLRGLSRRLAPVQVTAAEPEQALGMVRARAGQYEQFHGVRFSEEALLAAVQWATRLNPGRALPGAAFDLLDETAGRIRGGFCPRPPRCTAAEVAPADAPALASTRPIDASSVILTAALRYPTTGAEDSAAPATGGPASEDACEPRSPCAPHELLQRVARRLEEVSADLHELRAQVAELLAQEVPASPPPPDAQPGSP